jgi:hypothetical protein
MSSPASAIFQSPARSPANTTPAAPNTPGFSNTVRLTKTQEIKEVKRATYEEFERLRTDIELVERQGVLTTNFYAHMSKGVIDAVNHEVKQLYIENEEADGFVKNCWWNWPAMEFFHVMNNRFRLTTAEKSVQQDFLDECKKLTFEYRTDSSGESDFIVSLTEVASKTKVLLTLESENDDTLTTTQRKSQFNTLLYNIRKKGKGSPQIRQYIADKLQSLMTGDKNVWLLNKFLDELRTMTAKARRIFGEVLDYTTGATDSSTTEGDRDLRVGKKDKRDKKKKETKRDKTKGDSPKNQKSSKSPSSVRKRCTNCNSNRHESDKCSFVDHPDFIKSGAWSDSDIGQAYVLLDPKSPYLIEGRHLSDDMSKFIYPKKTPKTPAKPKGKPVKSGNVMACCSDCAESTPSVPDKPLDDVLVPVTLLHRQAKD